MNGSPWYRLLRHEVESLVRGKSGQDHLLKKKLQKESVQRKLQQKCNTANKIIIDVRNGDITLTGTLKEEHERKPIMRCLAAIQGVRRVVDKLELELKKKPLH